MKRQKTGERVLISFDYALKRLLRDKVNYEILEGFLSVLFSRNVSVKNIGESESNKDHATDKYNRVDILVEDESGEILLIELQFMPEIDFLHRMLFGTSKTVVERMFQGAEYLEVKKVYSINIVYFDLGQGDDYVYHGKTHFRGIHKNDELYLSSAQRKVFEKETAGDIYPEYYLLKVNNFDGPTKDMLDEWIYFLKNSVIRDEFKARGLKKARKALDRDNLTPEEQKAYDYMMYQRSENLSAIASSKLEGRMEGLEEGRKEGLEAGLEAGREEREKLERQLEKERLEREKLAEEYARILAEAARLKQGDSPFVKTDTGES
ncbi:MAG: Rpn family recombination-promoting nuclease/putative transposase [Tannerella sp.]|jgi:predicted transposase/invertase (TIGR01784 family)|nr:Rpn family recombination-promoting nuclease/putative transposase [Tannerella sp.]